MTSGIRSISADGVIEVLAAAGPVSERTSASAP